MAKDKYTAAQVADALTKTKGMVTLAAQQLGCDYHTVQRYIRDFPTVAAAKQQAHEQMGDAAELKLYTLAVTEGNPTALIFLLKTQFKKRGYVEKLEIDVRYVALIKQIDALAQEQGLEASDIFNGIIAELSTAGVSADTDALGSGRETFE